MGRQARFIKGETVKLIQRKESSVDPFGGKNYTNTVVKVENVIIKPASSEDVAENYNLYGKRLAYTLAIPKEDKNDWTDVEVEFFNKRFRSFGHVVQLIDHLTPLDWNKEVKVEMF